MPARGHAGLVILALLEEKAHHGFGITPRVERMNLGQFPRVGAATAYGVRQDIVLSFYIDGFEAEKRAAEEAV